MKLVIYRISYNFLSRPRLNRRHWQGRRWRRVGCRLAQRPNPSIDHCIEAPVCWPSPHTHLRSAGLSSSGKVCTLLAQRFLSQTFDHPFRTVSAIQSTSLKLISIIDFGVKFKLWWLP